MYIHVDLENFYFHFSTSQGFGVLSVALCSKAIQLLKELLDDLQIEGFLSDTVRFIERMRVRNEKFFTKALKKNFLYHDFMNKYLFTRETRDQEQTECSFQ